MNNHEQARTQFDYLLNAFEHASQSEKPAAHGYGDKRKALFAYVRDLECRAALQPTEQPEAFKHCKTISRESVERIRIEFNDDDRRAVLTQELPGWKLIKTGPASADCQRQYIVAERAIPQSAEQPEACDTCHGSGQICVGTSGLESDGNAPLLEPCPECAFSAEQPEAAQDERERFFAWLEADAPKDVDIYSARQGWQAAKRDAAQAPQEQFDFTIDPPNSIPGSRIRCIRWKNGGGCRPAVPAEIAMWDALHAPQERAAVTDEQIAQAFHEAYERLAPSLDYETREASRKPWKDVPANNRALMTAVCGELRALLSLSAQSSEQKG